MKKCPSQEYSAWTFVQSPADVNWAHGIGTQAPVSIRYAWAPSRVYQTARTGRNRPEKTVRKMMPFFLFFFRTAEQVPAALEDLVAAFHLAVNVDLCRQREPWLDLQRLQTCSVHSIR